MITKQLYIIPVLITGELPPRYMPDEFTQPSLGINDHLIEFLNINVQQRYDGPHRVNAAGIVVIASRGLRDAIYAVIDCGWVKLSDHGISAMLDDVCVEIDDGHILVVNPKTGTMERKSTNGIHLPE
ncbi:MAG: hypothetical protein ACNI26_04105 [Terasakiella sp.]|uniref:hypothetical protein n=1 Tax=unclassified Terasakiella TaxID=2614952 RepID=UPI003AFFC54C